MTALALAAFASYVTAFLVDAWSRPPTRYRIDPPIYPLDLDHYLLEAS